MKCLQHRFFLKIRVETSSSFYIRKLFDAGYIGQHRPREKWTILYFRTLIQGKVFKKIMSAFYIGV